MNGPDDPTLALLATCPALVAALRDEEALRDAFDPGRGGVARRTIADPGPDGRRRVAAALVGAMGAADALAIVDRLDSIGWSAQIDVPFDRVRGAGSLYLMPGALAAGLALGLTAAGYARLPRMFIAPVALGAAAVVWTLVRAHLARRARRRRVARDEAFLDLRHHYAPPALGSYLSAGAPTRRPRGAADASANARAERD